MATLHSACILPAVFQKLQNPTSLNAVIENAREWSTSEERFGHTYQFELENFEPSEEQLQLKEPQVCRSFYHQLKNFCILYDSHSYDQSYHIDAVFV